MPSDAHSGEKQFRNVNASGVRSKSEFDTSRLLNVRDTGSARLTNFEVSS